MRGKKTHVFPKKLVVGIRLAEDDYNSGFDFFRKYGSTLARGITAIAEVVIRNKITPATAVEVLEDYARKRDENGKEK